jgi:hypothetical protein
MCTGEHLCHVFAQTETSNAKANSRIHNDYYGFCCSSDSFIIIYEENAEAEAVNNVLWPL